jgi:hypothetical protein
VTIFVELVALGVVVHYRRGSRQFNGSEELEVSEHLP